MGQVRIPERTLFSTAQQSFVTLVPAAACTPNAATIRFCRHYDKLCHFGIGEMRLSPDQSGDDNWLKWRHLAAKAKGATDCSVAPRLVPSPRHFAKLNYCNCMYGAVVQVKATVVGAALWVGS